MTRAPHYAIAAIVVAALSLAVAPLALKRSRDAATSRATVAHVTVQAAGQGYTVTPSSLTIPAGKRLVVDNRDSHPHPLVQVSGLGVAIERHGASTVIRFPARGVYTFTVTSDDNGDEPLAVVVSR